MSQPIPIPAKPRDLYKESAIPALQHKFGDYGLRTDHVTGHLPAYRFDHYPFDNEKCRQYKSQFNDHHANFQKYARQITSQGELVLATTSLLLANSSLQKIPQHCTKLSEHKLSKDFKID